MMNAAILHALGETPRFGQFEEPTANPSEALVHVAAASIKQLDKGIARGTHYASPRNLPVVCGTDGVGHLEDGSHVYFAAMRQPYGAMAERSVASWWVPMPDNVDDATAAALVNPALGAWLPLEWRGEIIAGETVLVIGATGATGRLAVKIARILGAGRIVAAGRNRAKLEALGADAIVNTELPKEDLTQAFIEAGGPKGYDLVVDYLWGSPIEALIPALTGSGLHTANEGSERGVRLVSVGALSGPDITLPSSVLRSSFLRILGSGTGNFPPETKLKQIVSRILAHAAEGTLGIETDSVPLTAVEDAWNAENSADCRKVLLPTAS